MWYRKRNVVLPLVYYLLSHLQVVDSSKNRQRYGRRVQGIALAKQDAQYQECVDDFYASDINDNMELSRDEYLLFVAKRSDGVILVDEFTDLPFSLTTIFVYGACFCSIVSQTPNCCVGTDAPIDLNPEDSPFIGDNLITLCINVDEAIARYIGSPTPTFPSFPPFPPPSDSPTEEPSLAPEPTIAPTTLMPSESPSFAPTSQKTLEPSESPSISPTNESSLEPSVLPTTIEPSVTPSLAPSDISSMGPSSAPTIVTQSKFTPTKLTWCIAHLMTSENYNIS
jgi:hypothetical protein